MRALRSTPPTSAVEQHALGVNPRRYSRQSVIVGIGATMLVHFLIVPVSRALQQVDTSIVPQPKSDVELEFEDLTTAELQPGPAPETPRFVETNPEAPENVPDDTPNESDRNQQSANEIEPEGLSPDRTPAREGEELDTNKIVAGDPTPPVPAEPPLPQGESSPAVAPSAPPAQEPLPGFEEDVGDSPDGIGTNIARETTNPDPEQETEEEGEASETEIAQPAIPPSPPGVARPTPAPRPRVNRALPGPVERQRLGVSQTGYVGIDARYSRFGDYMARMREAVQQRWDALCDSRAYGEHATNVVLQFTLTRDGHILDVTTVESTAKSVGVFLCRAALEQGQPYGPWTEDMVKILGEEEQMTFTFYYR